MHFLLVLAACALALAVLVALTNYLIDPAGLYHPGNSKQARNLRLRKLSLLKGLRRQPCATLILGSSRVFNLSLAGDERFPQPTLNFAVTTAKAEDYLAGYRLVREAVGGPPSRPPLSENNVSGDSTTAGGDRPPLLRLVIIGIEHPAFHPTLRPQWEAYTAGRYTQELEAIGALRRGRGWRWRMLLSPLQFRQSLIAVQRKGLARGGLAGFLVSGYWRPPRPVAQKFRWAADGSGTWMDLLEGKRNPRLLLRQLRNFPRTGLALRRYTRVSERRLRWFGELLADCAADGARVLAYIVPAHPQLVEKTWQLGFRPMHDELATALAEACARHGAEFRDWYDGQDLGLTEEHFRDVMHLTDEGQAVIAARLAEL